MTTAKIEAIRVESIVRWCNDHYDEGGHWVIETMDRETIADKFGSLDDAIKFCHAKECQSNELR